MTVDPGRAVFYEVVLKSGTEEIDMSDSENYKKVFRLSRSDLEDLRELFVPDGTCTVLCFVRSREPGSAVSPKSGWAQTRVIRQYRMTGNLSSESFLCLCVTWIIPEFFQIRRESTYTLRSPEFPFDLRYRLRLFPSRSENYVYIHLLNSTDPVPGRYFSYEVGLESITGEEIEIGCYGPSTKRNFCILRSDLDDMQLVHFPDGRLTVFCWMRSREPSSGGSPKSVGAETPGPKADFPQAAAHPKSSGDETSDEEEDQEALPGCRSSFSISSGELSFESSSSLRTTWTIPDFFRLATECDYSLRSPDFTFADGRYCLRLFQTRQFGSDWIGIELHSSIDTDPGRADLYEVELKSRTGEIDFYRYVKNETVFRLSRSYLECERDLCFPDGTLTELCSVRSTEPGSAGIPRYGGVQTRVFPQYRMTGNLSSESFPFLYVTWRIPAFFQFIRESRHTLESPEFPFSNHCYHLRLFPYERDVEIHLVDMTDTVPGRYVSYGIGLKSTTGEEIDIQRWGTSTERRYYILQSELYNIKPAHFPNGHLTAFCCMRSREPSSAGSPKSGGSETPGSKADVPQAAAHPKSSGDEISDEEEDQEALPGCRPSFSISSGELSFESPSSVRVTWIIPDFFGLETESDYSLRGPEFTFADGRYCLRFFPYRDLDHKWFGIELLNSIEIDPGRAVLYEIELKSGTREIDLYRHIYNKTVFRLDRSDLEGERDECVHDGTLTVLCFVRSREPGSAGSPKSGAVQTRIFPQYRMTGNLSSESYPCLYVTWRIPEFFKLTRESRCDLESPEFPFSDRRYRLRLFLSEYVVEIHLVNMTDTVPGRYVSYEVGMNSTTGEEIYIGRYGQSTTRRFYIPRSTLADMQPVRFPDCLLTVFCCMRSREPSNAGSPKSVGAETPGSKVPVPQAAAHPKSNGDETSNEEDDKEALPGISE